MASNRGSLIVPFAPRPAAGAAAARRHLKLLVVASRVPDRHGRADQRTVYRFVEYMAGRGHRLTVYALDSWEASSGSTEGLARLCERLEIFRQPLIGGLAHGLRGFVAGRPLQVGALWNPPMARALRQLSAIERFDLIYAHLIRTAEYVRDLRGAPKVLAMQVAQSLNLDRMVRYRAGIGARLAWRLELALVRRYERAVARAFDRCLVISAHDRAAIGLAPAQTWLAPHGVDIREFAPSAAAHRAPLVVFSGMLNTAANIEAAGWLLESIWPQVIAAEPGARLRIVGREPAARVRRLAHMAGVELVDSPQALAPYLREATVAVAPVRIAAGLQNKILEAMASGLAVVATPQANEGIGARPNHEILLAEDAPGFARAIVQLLKMPAIAREIGSRARALIEQRWSWEHHLRRLEGRLMGLVDAHAGNRRGR